MPPVRRARVLLICTALLLAAFVIARPEVYGARLRKARTPFDRGGSYTLEPNFTLLTEAARVVPEGETVVAYGVSGDPIEDTYLHWQAIALMPRHRVVPAAAANRPRPQHGASARYVVLRGGLELANADRVLASEFGSVWRRR